MYIKNPIYSDFLSIKLDSMLLIWVNKTFTMFNQSMIFPKYDFKQKNILDGLSPTHLKPLPPPPPNVD